MTNKMFRKGIEIPVECGKSGYTDKIVVMYQDMNKEQLGNKCNIYITEEDYKDGKPFATVVANINPIIFEYFNEDDLERGKCIVQGELFDNSEYSNCGSKELDIIISNLGEYAWEYTTLAREEYLSIVPKRVIQYGEDFYIEENWKQN